MHFNLEMAWRDRTNLYISYRQSYAHHPAKAQNTFAPRSNGYSDNPEERRGLMGQGEDAIIEMDVLPPRWLDIQDQVTDLLESVAQNTARLDTMHSKHVLPGFEDEAVKRKEERQIEALTQEITRCFQSCQKAIKRVEVMLSDSHQHGHISKGEDTMARNLQISLASRVGEVSANFRKKQSTYLKKMRTLNGMGTPVDGTSTPIPANPYADPSMIESDADRSFSQSTLQQTAQKRHTGNDVVIAQREKEIEDIAQGIIELANIFQELQTMVIDQGTMLDRIDYNVERMAVDVKGAEKELKVATGYQKRSTKRKIILLLILLVVAMIILVSIRSGKSSSRAPIDSAPPADRPADVPPP